jgi:hypothetical protein
VNDLSTKGKISVLVGFFSIISAVPYIFIVMEGRTTATEKDNWFFMTVIVIAAVSVVITIADRAKTKGEGFSWRKFGSVLLVALLYGLWKLLT